MGRMQGTLPGYLAPWIYGLRSKNLFQDSSIAGDLILNTLPGMFRAHLGTGYAKPAESKAVAREEELVGG